MWKRLCATFFHNNEDTGKAETPVFRAILFLPAGLASEGRRPAAEGFPGMFVLMRRISAYTGPDVLLGVFATRDEAEEAAARYARVREADPTADPWKDQGYKPDTVVSRDLTVEQLPGKFPTGEVVYVVSDHSDGFGQEVRKLDSLHATSASATARMEELDAVEDEEFPFPHYAVIDPVVVGSLHSDLPDDQPQPKWRQRPNQPLHLPGKVRPLFRDR